MSVNVLDKKMSNERYLRNRTRVFEIYGIHPNDQRYNCHHIVCKADVGSLVPADFDIDGKANLYPILKYDHDEVNRRIDMDTLCGETEHYSKHPKKKKHQH
jgi:hypothetical protein